MSTELEAVARSFLQGTDSLQDYLDFFTDDCHYKVANQPVVEGKASLSQAAARFRSMVKSVRHEVLSCYEFEDRVVCDIIATYTKNDDQVVTLPCLDIFTFSAAKIKSLQIFVDLSPLFVP